MTMLCAVCCASTPRSSANHKACHHPHEMCVPYLEGVAGEVDVDEVDASEVRTACGPPDGRLPLGQIIANGFYTAVRGGILLQLP